MNKRLVHVEVDGLEVGLTLGEGDMLAGVGDLDSFAEAQHLDALVEVLPVEVHQVAGLVLLEAAL